MTVSPSPKKTQDRDDPNWSELGEFAPILMIKSTLPMFRARLCQHCCLIHWHCLEIGGLYHHFPFEQSHELEDIHHFQSRPNVIFSCLFGYESKPSKPWCPGEQQNSWVFLRPPDEMFHESIDDFWLDPSPYYPCSVSQIHHYLVHFPYFTRMSTRWCFLQTLADFQLLYPLVII